MASVHDLFDRDEIDRRKQLVRDLWAGKPVNHIPTYLIVSDPEPGPTGGRPTVREQFQDADKQLAVAMRTAVLSWQTVPEGDYIPAMRPDVGCSCLATAFGATLYWGDDPNQTCGVREPPIRDIDQVLDLQVPPPDAGQLTEGIARVRRFAQAGEGLVSVSLLDMAGGINVAADLLGCAGLYLSMVEAPELLECLLAKIQQLFLSTIAEQIEAAGGEEHITTTDFPDTWFPEGRKGHVSDDISTNISPALYRRFSTPYHNLIFARYGGGGLHNCGPNPCLAEYLEHTPPPRSLDLSYAYSKGDLDAIKKVCRKRALVYMADFPDRPAEAVEAYRQIMERMTPDVIVIPTLCVTTSDDVPAIHRRLREISQEYARRMDWGWE